MEKYSVYIDESGDLGANKGTRWFVLTAVVVKQTDEPIIRNRIKRIREKLKKKEIHFTHIQDYNARGYIVKELAKESFAYMNVLVDTAKYDTSKMSSYLVAYNFICRYLIERVSYYLAEKDGVGDVVLSARSNPHDQELIHYIKDKLLPYAYNGINRSVFGKVEAKKAAEWDMLQLADVCASSTFTAFEQNKYGMCTPCFLFALSNHLYRKGKDLKGYGLKFFTPEMDPGLDYLKTNRACFQETYEERTPGTTAT